MFASLLLPVDLGAADTWTRPLHFALELCRVGATELHVVTVMPDYGMPIVGSQFDPSHAENAMQDIARHLEAWRSDNVPDDITCHLHVENGPIYDRIMYLANRLAVEAIVIGAHKPEMKDYLLGTNAARVVRHAKQSVLVVRAPA